MLGYMLGAGVMNDPGKKTRPAGGSHPRAPARAHAGSRDAGGDGGGDSGGAGGERTVRLDRLRVEGRVVSPIQRGRKGSGLDERIGG